MTFKPWWTPLTGVAFVVVVIVSFAVGGEPPDIDEGAARVVAHYKDNKDAIEMGAILSGLAGALLIFFAGTLRSALRSAEGEHGVLSLCAFAGAVVVAIGAAVDATLAFAIAEAVDEVEPVTVHTLQALWDNDFIPFAMGNLVFTWAVGLSIVRHGALPTWLGWVAIVLGLASMTPAGFIAFLGTAIWIIVVSVMLALQGRAQPAAPAAPV